MNCILRRSVAPGGIVSHKLYMIKRLFSTPIVKVIGDDVPIVVQRAATKAAKEATEMQELKKSKSTFSQRITPFLWGFVIASFAGMYFLIAELRESNMQLQAVISAVRNDKSKRVQELEERIKRLE